MQMSKREVYTRFHNMKGEASDRIKILSELNACSEKHIREVIQDVESGRCTEPEISTYHPDLNPFSKVEVEIPKGEKHKGDIPEHVLNLIFDRLDELDREIKAKQNEYNELVEYIGGK